MALLTSSVTSLFFFQAECLYHFQQPKISLRRRGFAHDNPPRHWGGPQTVTLWGLLRMRVMRLFFDPDRTRGCYTQARKRVASHYLCSLDCTSFPVWTGWDSMGTHYRHVTLQFHVDFSHEITAECVSRWETFTGQPVTILYVFYCVCRNLNASTLMEFLRVAHFVWDLQGNVRYASVFEMLHIHTIVSDLLLM